MTAAPFRFCGPLESLDRNARRASVARGQRSDDAAARDAATILARVRADGDAALFSLARALDGVELDALEVPRAEWQRALDATAPELRSAMERAVANIATAHRAMLPQPMEVETEPGVIVGRRPDPLERIGVYAPGGRAAYPSSVLMGVVPAQVAGVGDIVVCSPPGRNGLPAQTVLAAAALGGADRLFAVGGAGAIGAMAYGTETVPRVDRIVGPGNAWVTAAKLQVTDCVAIDAPAGPSELLVIADDSADPDAVAREVAAQAEHDPHAAVVVVALDARAAASILAAVRRAMPRQPRRTVIADALAARGALLTARDLDEAIAYANEFAAEHVLLALGDPEPALGRLRGAGTVFVGDSSSVAFGDYMTGANHVLPTGGLARSYSGLSTLDFFRWTTWQRVTPAAAARLSEDVAVFADAEGLPAHAAAARGWVSATESEAPAPALRLRPDYREITLYSPDRTPCTVDLSDNTNLWGAPPAALAALRLADQPAITRYPSLYAPGLKDALALYAGVGPDEVVTGCGSDDVLDSAFRAFAAPGDRVAYPDPSFAMIPIFARMNGLIPVAVPLGRGFDVDADAMLATGARIIYLCSPNNPTGTAVGAAAIERLVERAPGLVILDEAYAEFAGSDGTARWIASGRVLVTRTLSKAFGLAGLRIGYAVGAPALVAAVEKSRGPYKVSAVAERASVAALGPGLPWVRERVAEAIGVREQLAARLRALGLEPLPSVANFVLVPVPDAAATAARLRERGIAVRPFTGLQRVGDALRITVGPWPLLEECLVGLEEALA
jgi:histidinol dehydrogenase